MYSIGFKENSAAHEGGTELNNEKYEERSYICNYIIF